ncbi:Domain of uncharacterised function (DUF3560) [Nocardia otitidiscaviarum]|uniref:Domain of uncharacterized function (DUF3560) n=1 Tax=Nocardia otitidiscaviarum TaxID=1823 RepID=A0A379JLN6_9NOCA|nr:DUF3560 domain-containing protein [Nocardia otitidiscaviarum]SUD49527.1 Domain of uncharacterised function (DUF3560) [Nocardia otitidiscaviarum]
MTDTLTIAHTAAEGTRLEGTQYGDGTYEIMSALEQRIGRYWKWSRSLSQWIVYRSRDRQPTTWVINAAVEALTTAGYTVTVDIDRTHRDPAQVAADRAADRAAYAAAVHAKAERHRAAADAADARAARAHDSLPPGGEPIKYGHHSQRRHERLHEAADRTARQASEARAKAAATEQRAQVAESNATTPEPPDMIQRRIARLEAEQRAAERRRDGYRRSLGINGQTGTPIIEECPAARGDYRARLVAEIAQRADEIAHQRSLLAAAQAAGAVVFTPDMIRPGDYVHARGHVRPEPVVRVNKTTVTLDVAPGWNNKYPINKITGITNRAGERVSFDAQGRRSDEQPTG